METEKYIAVSHMLPSVERLPTPKLMASWTVPREAPDAKRVSQTPEMAPTYCLHECLQSEIDLVLQSCFIG